VADDVGDQPVVSDRCRAWSRTFSAKQIREL
jgi:hypothetical protein